MLKAQILQAVEAARTALQDLLVVGTFTTKGDPVHIPGLAPTYDETEYDLDIAIVGYKAKEIDGDRIKSHDMQGIAFPTTGPVPRPNDVITTDRKYRIITNEPAYAGDEVAISILQLRPI